MKNWKQIVESYDKVEKVYSHSSKPIVNVTGIKGGELHSENFEYKHKKVAEKVFEKISVFVGV